MDSWFACHTLKAAQPIVWERMRLSAPSLSQAGTGYPSAAGNPGVMTENKSTGDARGLGAAADVRIAPPDRPTSAALSWGQACFEHFVTPVDNQSIAK
jgi:hypothetical protein